MKPAKEKYYRSLFSIAAVYDVLLGLTFTFFPAQAFDALGIREKLPAFGGYLTLLGAFVLLIGIAYFLIANGDLRRNLDLILVGTLYKLAPGPKDKWKYSVLHTFGYGSDGCQPEGNLAIDNNGNLYGGTVGGGKYGVGVVFELTP